MSNGDASRTATHGDEWMHDEIERLEGEPCLCEPCLECTNRGCDECDGLGVSIYCERCEQIHELEVSLSYAVREVHGHFGSGHS